MKVVTGASATNSSVAPAKLSSESVEKGGLTYLPAGPSLTDATSNSIFPAAAVCPREVAGGCANAIDVVAETTITRNFTNALRLVIYFVLNTSLQIDVLRRI